MVFVELRRLTQFIAVRRRSLREANPMARAMGCKTIVAFALALVCVAATNFRGPHPTSIQQPVQMLQTHQSTGGVFDVSASGGVGGGEASASLNLGGLGSVSAGLDTGLGDLASGLKEKATATVEKAKDTANKAIDKVDSELEKVEKVAKEAASKAADLSGISLAKQKCTACEFLVRKLKADVDAGSINDQTDFEKLAFSYCDMGSAPIAIVCKQSFAPILKDKGTEIAEQVRRGQNSNTICVSIGLCTADGSIPPPEEPPMTQAVIEDAQPKPACKKLPPHHYPTADLPAFPPPVKTSKYRPGILPTGEFNDAAMSSVPQPGLYSGPSNPNAPPEPNQPFGVQVGTDTKPDDAAEAGLGLGGTERDSAGRVNEPNPTSGPEQTNSPPPMIEGSVKSSQPTT